MMHHEHSREIALLACQSGLHGWILRRLRLKDRPDSPLDLTECAPFAPKLASICAAIASDVALVVDAHGVIRSVSASGPAMAALSEGWEGQVWSETVTAETRQKIEQVLEEASTVGHSRRREVNLRTAGGSDLAMNYAAIRLGDSDTFLVAGKDLTKTAAVQRKFLERQRELEQDYWRRRKLDTRYRLLFQAATDAVMVIDAGGFTIIDANEASARLFDVELDLLIGQDVGAGVMRLYRPAVHELLTTSRASGQPAEIKVPLARKIGNIALSATPLRGPEGIQLLVRARETVEDGTEDNPGRPLVEFVERMPDPVVITDSGGQVLMGNPAFYELVRVPDANDAIGKSLSTLLRCAPDALEKFTAHLKQHGMASDTLASIDPSTDGNDSTEFQLIGTLLDEADQGTIGFSIRRSIEHQPAAPPPAPVQELSERLSLLGEQLGIEELPHLVARAGKLVETYIVDLALERAGGDVELAAKMLRIDAAELQRIKSQSNAQRKPSSRD
jgi:transcriptional regulator PpsR